MKQEIDCTMLECFGQYNFTENLFEYVFFG